MGDKKNDAKKMLDTINDTILRLERRQRELQSETDPETGKYSGRVESELIWVNRNLSLAKNAKKEVQESLERAKTEEEKKRVMNVVALAMLVGAVNENLRLAEERAKREDVISGSVEEFKEEVVEALFASYDFRFITIEDVEEILQDPELRAMAAADPNKLEREEADFRAEYEAMMNQVLSLAGEAVGEDFQENEQKFKNLMAEKNDMERAHSLYEKRIREGILKDENLPQEDRLFFTGVLDELKELAGITRNIQDQFVREDDFDHGNGYTQEVLDREKTLEEKVDDYVGQKLQKINGMLQLGPEDEQVKKTVKLFSQGQMLQVPIKRQMARDGVLLKNNILQRRKERWMVFQQLPQDDRPEIFQESVEVKNRKAAEAKLDRMERQAVRHSVGAHEHLTEEQRRQRERKVREGEAGLNDFTEALAVDEVRSLLEQLEGGHIPKKQVLSAARKSLATLVLHQLVMNDIQRRFDEPQYYFDAVKVPMTPEHFMAVAEELSNTKEFRKAMDPLLKGKSVKDNVYRFIARDFERQVAKKVYAEKKAKMEREAAPQKSIRRFP